MSNYTTFFPSATGGTTEITNPDKLPLSFIGNSSTTGLEECWWTINSSTAGTAYLSNTSLDPLVGVNSTYNTYAGQATLTAGVEATLVNITSGSGYLCNVTSAMKAADTTNIKITIIVDGTTYTYDYANHYSNWYARMFWGYFSTGNWSNLNLPNDTTNIGMQGNSGYPQLQSTTLPPLYKTDTAGSPNRVFSVPEFRLHNLPKLRFESSLVVKVENDSIYSTSNYFNKAAATYYLDTYPL